MKAGVCMYENEKTKLQKIIDDSTNIVFFGGAGVSTESGIPDFRSADGTIKSISTLRSRW